MRVEGNGKNFDVLSFLPPIISQKMLCWCGCGLWVIIYLFSLLKYKLLTACPISLTQRHYSPCNKNHTHTDNSICYIINSNNPLQGLSLHISWITQVLPNFQKSSACFFGNHKNCMQNTELFIAYLILDKRFITSILRECITERKRILYQQLVETIQYCPIFD